MKTTVKIRKVFDCPDSKIKAIASVTLDDLFVVHGVKVIEADKGRFLSMPSENRTNAQDESTRRDIFHPITPDARKQLEQAVYGAYEAALTENRSKANQPCK